MNVLIGDGAHARDIWAVLEAASREDDPAAQRRWRRVAHHNVYVGADETIVIGVNDPHLRAKIAADLGVQDAPWIHPDAKLYADCTYGYGTHVNYGVTMTRTTIGNHTTIAPGVTICGDVMIGDRVLIGAGATICDRVVIGDDVIVGAGAVVLPCTEIKPHVTVMGVPAKSWTGG